MHNDIERQMRAAERERTRALVIGWSLGGVCVLGISLVVGAWAVGSRDEEPRAQVAPAPVVEVSPGESPEASTAVAADADSWTAPSEPTSAPEPEPTPMPSQKPAPKKTPAPVPPAEKPAPTVQRFSIAIGEAGYEPTIVTAKTGVPIQLTVEQGDGCAAGFLIAELGVSADNSTRAAVVSLPALSPGMYRFTCGMEMVEGRLVVQ